MSQDETLAAGGPRTPARGGVADIDEKVLAEAVRRGFITPSQGAAAREEARARGVPLLGVLRAKGLVDEGAARDLDEETKEEFVPGYRVLSKLGEGGMGVVYRALQKRLDREVALKVVMPIYASDPSYLKRFEREARAVAKLNHPSIVAAYDYGESNGRVFLAMEFVEGVNLADWIRKNGPMPADRALAVARDVASGLAHACAAGIIHRDIKPGNILIADRRPGETSGLTLSGAKVTDLGLARHGNQAGMTELTAAGSILGTPGYMPPEQAFGEAVDHRADIYALGATLYQVLTGRRPFEAPTPMGIIACQQHQQLPDPRDLAADIPPGLPALLQGMMSRDASTRYPSWKEVLADIDRVRGGGAPVLALPPEDHRSLAASTGAAPPAPTMAMPPRTAIGSVAPTLSTPAVGVVVRPASASASASPSASPSASLPASPSASASAATAPPPSKPSKTPILVGGAVLLAAGIAAAVFMQSGGPKEPVGPPKVSPPDASAPDREVDAALTDSDGADAKTAFARVFEVWRRRKDLNPERRARLQKAVEKARLAVESKVDAHMKKGEYGEALALVRWVKAELGTESAPHVDELLATLEKVGDRGPAERAAVKAIREAKEKNDPAGILVASEGFEGKFDFSPDLADVKGLRAWAESVAPMVRIESEPAGALLLVDGKEIGATPREFRGRVGAEIQAEFRLDGYEIEKRSLWVKNDEPPRFTVPLKPARAKDPEPAILLVSEGEGRPLWTGASLGAWSPADGQWNVSKPLKKVWLEGEEKDEPAACLRGNGSALATARFDLAGFVKDAAGWRLEWQMIGTGRRTGNVALVEMQFASRTTGGALVLGIDDQGAYLGTREGATKALTRSHRLADKQANYPHTFAVELHGDVFVATVDGTRLGAVAAPADLVTERTIRAGVEGGVGYFSDILLTRLRKP